MSTAPATTATGPRKLVYALCHRADRLRQQGEYDQAEALFKQALARAEQVFSPDVLEDALAFVAVLNNHAVLYKYSGRFDEAEQLYRRALAMKEKLLGADHPDVAMTLNNLGVVLDDVSEKSAAREAYEEALPIYRRLAEAHPAAFLPDVAMTLNNLGNVLGDVGDKSTALDAWREALEIRWPLVQEHPRAYGRQFFGTLSQYVANAPEDENDPWRQLAATLAKSEDDSSAAPPAAE